ncbi:MAG: hypothetical protein PHS14_14545 [Elusimicrobia bacterium]|nr:hypothetical protein [Elusimicrobiota bacterium]
MYPKQREALFAPHRIVIIEASTKSGKTAGSMIWFLEQALRHGKPGRSFWWLAPSRGQAKMVYERYKTSLQWSGIQKQARMVGGAGGPVLPNDSELTLKLPNGAVLWFKTAEEPDLLYGEDVWAAIVDEAPRCRAEAWIALRSTITATGAPVRAIGHPKGRGTWHYKLGQQALEMMAADPSERELAYFHLTWRDAVAAKLVPLAEIEGAKRTMPEIAFRELYEAEASESAGTPFGHEHLVECQLGPEDEIGEAVVWGWDLGKADDYTFGVGLDLNASVCRAAQWRQVPWPETMARIIRETNGKPAWIDATGLGDPIFDAISRTPGGGSFVPFVISSPSKQELMERLAVGLQQHTIGLIDPTPEDPRWDAETRRCGDVLFTELDSFEFTYTGRAVRYSAPEGMHDDGVIALGLAYSCWLQQRPGEVAEPILIDQGPPFADLGGAAGRRWTTDDL